MIRRPVRFATLFFRLRWVAALAVLASCRPAAAQDRRILVQPGAAKVSRYSKIEFLLSWQKNVQPVGANPYDPADVDLRLEVTTPGGKRLVAPAFYYQPFERRQVPRGGKKAEWLYPTGQAEWRVRFAPMEAGTHTCVARLTDRAGTAESEPLKFECLPSKSKGYVRVSRKDPRFFEFSEGQAFFVVGQNVAFIRDSYAAAEMLRKLSENGANFVRVWACCEDWAMAVEARKSAWGRSWAWNVPIAVLPDRQGYHTDEKCAQIVSWDQGTSVALAPCHELAARPNTKYVLTGQVQTDKGASLEIQVQGAKPDDVIAGARNWTRFKREFTTSADQLWMPRIVFKLLAKGVARVRGLSLKEAGGGPHPEMLWEADVNRPPRGVYNQPDCFMLDKVVEAAEAGGLHLELCLLTRDHYMHALGDPRGAACDLAIADAKKLLRYAVARWGYSTSVAAWEYFNEMNPGLPTDRFYAECGEHLERIDPYHHLRATSAWGPSKKDWQHPRLDMADMHYYMRPVTGELFKDAPASVLARARILREQAPDKPALLSEFGVIGDNWQPTEQLKRDRTYVHLHNALWTSALSGLSGTVMHWFWDDIHKDDFYYHYRPVSAFVADIPFTTAKLRVAEAAASQPGFRVIGLCGQDRAYLWVFDPQATWWKMGEPNASAKDVKGLSVTLRGPPAGSYRVEWWDTWKGRPMQQAEAVVGRTSKDGLRLDVPTFAKDIACKIVAAGG